MMNTNDAMLCACATSGGAAWTPANLSNKVGWWRASDIAGKSDGDSVTAWPDSFGLLSDATGSGTFRTGVNGIGGQPAIELNGTTSGFGTGYTGTPTDFFCWGVFDMGAVNNFEALIGNEYTTGFMVSRNAFSSNMTAYLIGLSGSQTIALTTIGYYFFGRSGSTKIFEHNTVINSTTGSTTAFAGNELALGRWGMSTSSGRLAGKLSETGFLAGYPSAEDLSNLCTYITDKYGIATS